MATQGEWLSFLREQFPVGSRIKLQEMKDPYHPVKPGTMGTLTGIDDMGTFHCAWDNGRGLGLVLGEDRFSVLPPETHTIKLYMPMTVDYYERNEWGDAEEEPLTMSGSEAAAYAPQIIAALQRERTPEEAERGLMAYYGEDDGMNSKVRSLTFTAEVRDGKLWGVAECNVQGELTQEEMSLLEAFTRYANGETVTDISNRLNEKNLRTAKGVEFNKNSFHSMFRNERYIGVYTYKDLRKEGAIPAIVPREIWDRVQDRLKENGLAPARGKALVNYILVGKLFCGHCGSMMVGESGTGRHGGKYHYYTCAGRKRRRECDKKPMKKDWLEQVVAEDALALLTDDVIGELAEIAIQQSASEIQHNTIIPALEQQLKEAGDGISNIVSMIEQGIASAALGKRLSELEKSQRDLQRRLEKERKNVVILEKPQIIYWLKKFSQGDLQDEDFRRQIIDLLVNSVTVWDDPDGDYTITSTYNLTSNKTKTVKLKVPPKAVTTGVFGGSDLDTLAPP